MKTKKGFTLIELLVVIAIIGILSAIGIVALNGAREKARDAKKKNDLTQYRTALLMYYEDNSRTFYDTSVVECIDYNGVNYAYDGAAYNPNFNPTVFSKPGPLVPEYLAENLKPMKGNGENEGADYYCYDINQSNKNHYLLFTKLEGGDKPWYWLNDKNMVGVETEVHTPGACQNADCNWR